TYPFLQPITGSSDDFVSNLQCYSESTIKQQGSYSLKTIAQQTDSLSDNLTRTVSPTIDLSGYNPIKFDVRANRTGSNFKISIHDSGGTTTEHTVNITSANTWQTETWDISGVSDANKDAIDQIKITILNADADNTFYIDNMYANDTIVPTINFTSPTPANGTTINTNYTTINVTVNENVSSCILSWDPPLTAGSTFENITVNFTLGDIIYNGTKYLAYGWKGTASEGCSGSGAEKAIYRAEGTNATSFSSDTYIHKYTDNPCASYKRAHNPSIVKVGSDYYMYHEDYYKWVSGQWSGFISRLDSPDGYSWSNDLSVLEPHNKGSCDGDWDACHTEFPQVIYENGVYHLWYSTSYRYPCVEGGYFYSLAYANSTDGTTFSYRTRIVDENGNYINQSHAEYCQFQDSSIFKKDDIYYFIYSKDGDLYYRTSSDRITWEHNGMFLDNQTVADVKGGSGALYPRTVFNDTDNTLYLYFYFSGNNYKTTLSTKETTDYTMTVNNNDANTWANYTVTNLTEGTNYTYWVTCNDTSGNENQTGNRTLYVDLTAPTVTLNIPTNSNNSVDINSNVTFNCSAADNIALANITLWHNANETLTAIETKTLTGTSDSALFNKDLFDNNTIKDTTITWNCEACDSSNNCANASANYTFSGWDLGNYTNTTFNTSVNYIGLSANGSGQYPNTTGYYTSKIFNA
ncbi:MAG: hypothetical protein KAU20_02645, partial [Nanoarchaeota archaeon]|nr:hypothetical protein [Nanoarchaeota archaeon]